MSGPNKNYDGVNSNSYAFDGDLNSAPTFSGLSPSTHGFTLQPKRNASNPVLEGADTGANEVADPFAVVEDGTIHLFFEEIFGPGDAGIGHATSVDGVTWAYDQTVLYNSSFYAYPHVFKFDGTWYMVPNRTSPFPFEIYTTNTFPTGWTLTETAIAEAGADPTPFYYNNRWYVIAGYNGTKLYYADEGRSLTGRTWTEHPNSPIWTDTADDVQGPAGRPLVHKDGIDFVTQDDTAEKTQLWRITELSPTSFSRELMVDPLTHAVNAPDHPFELDMHHVDLGLLYSGLPHVPVDGNDGNFSIGVFEPGTQPTEAVAAVSGTITSGSVQTAPFDGSRYLNNVAALDFGNDVYVTPTAGVYEFTATIQFDDDTASEYQVRIQDRTNATQLGPIFNSGGAAGGSTSITATATRWRPEGTNIGVDVFQNTGANVDINNDSRFIVRRIR